MTTKLPSPTREYKNHHLDSTRWRRFDPRDDDIIISTSYKSGTTWMQQIVHRLVFKDTPDALPVGLVSPWMDARFHGSLEEILEGLSAQRHRRFIKSHLAFDGLPYYRQVKYVVVARDARDVFMSFWNHYRNYTDEIMSRLNDPAERNGDALPDPPAEDAIRDLWKSWMTRGWFAWESEGWPFWGNLHHTRTYWEHQDLENVLLVHYADLLKDPMGQIARLAGFLEIAVTSEQLERVVFESSFGEMKKAHKVVDGMFRQAFKGGSDAFIFKGTNGRWRDVLTSEDLALYEDTKSLILTPECAEWLEKGWLADDAGQV